MTYTPRVIRGTVANPVGTIYTVPTGFRAMVKGLHFFNGAGTTQILTLSMTINGSGAVEYDEHSMLTRTRYISVDETAPLFLSAADTIRALATTNAQVQFYVFVEEEQKG
jgi:hypothetical protein